MKRILGFAVGFLATMYGIQAAERTDPPAVKLVAAPVPKDIGLHGVVLGMPQASVEALSPVVPVGHEQFLRDLKCVPGEAHFQLLTFGNGKVDAVTEIGYRAARAPGEPASPPEYISAGAAQLWSRGTSVHRLSGRTTETRKLTWLAPDQQLNYIEQRLTDPKVDLVISQLGDGAQSDVPALTAFAKVLHDGHSNAVPEFSRCIEASPLGARKVASLDDIADLADLDEVSASFSSHATSARKGRLTLTEALSKLFDDKVLATDSPASLKARLSQAGIAARSVVKDNVETVTVEKVRQLGAFTFESTGIARFRFAKGKLIGFTAASERKAPGGVPDKRAQDMRDKTLTNFGAPEAEVVSDTHGMALPELSWTALDGATFVEKTLTYGGAPGRPTATVGETAYEWN